jgi:hypothetical protein
MKLELLLIQIIYCRIINAKGSCDMPDNYDGYELSGEDIVFIRTALEALKEDLAGLLADEAARANALWNIELIDSVNTKLDNREIQFSDDECRIMYVAALEMRDLMNKILDDTSSSAYDREMARSTLHSANAMLRVLRKAFMANGIDIDKPV